MLDTFTYCTSVEDQLKITLKSIRDEVIRVDFVECVLI